jgi:cytidylate kinase
VEEWMGLHPSFWTLVQQTNATILRLAQTGNVILVGRGATVITSKLKNVFHARLVGSLEKRIERVEQVYGLDRKSAIGFIKKKDEGRKRYLKDNFDADVDNPLLYHVTINTDLVRYDEAARLIGDEVIARFDLGSRVKAAGSGNRQSHQ